MENIRTFDSYRLNVCIFDVTGVGIGQTQYLVLVKIFNIINFYFFITFIKKKLFMRKM